jgi:ubiquinone/menaquinone biosynthesis C-methylase UbiE
MIPEEELISSNSFQYDRLKSLRQWLYREVKIAKYEKILDIGAGDLRISAEIAGLINRKVHALDMVKPDRIPDKVIFVKGRAEKLSFPKETFDVVAASFFFFWIGDLSSMLGRIRKVLKKDGIILILSEPQFSERADTPDSGLNSELKKGLKKLGANPNFEKTMTEALVKTGFTPKFFRTNEKVLIQDRTEIIEEIDFLFEKGIIDEKKKELLIKKESSLEEREVFLPIIYGYASL